MPVTLRVAIGLLWVQFLAMLGLLVIFMALLVQDPSPLGVYVGVFAAVFTAVLLLVILALRRHRSAARGGVLALELLVLAPAYYMITGGKAWLGLLIAAASIAVILLMVSPPTSRALS